MQVNNGNISIIIFYSNDIQFQLGVPKSVSFSVPLFNVTYSERLLMGLHSILYSPAVMSAFT